MHGSSFIFRALIVLFMSTSAGAGVAAQSGREPLLLEGTILRNINSASGVSVNKEAVVGALVLLCAIPKGDNECGTVASTVSDSTGKFQIVIDRLVSSSAYSIRCRGVGDVWDEQPLGLGQESTQWLKVIQIVIGIAPSIRESIEKLGDRLANQRAENLARVSHIQTQIQAMQGKIDYQQRQVQTEQAAIEHAGVFTGERAAQAKMNDDRVQSANEQQMVRGKQQTLAKLQAQSDALQSRQNQLAEQKQALAQQPYRFQVKRVLFATDRAVTDRQGHPEMLNVRNSNGELAFGICDVAIERQGSFSNNLFHLIEDRDADRFYSVQGRSLLNQVAIWNEVRTELSAVSTQDALLFIPGFNVSFDEGCRRAAQIAYDIKFAGPIFLYSWPSQNSLFGYVADETMSEWSAPHFTKFLKELLEKHGIDHLHIVAHSMGNRILVKALFADKLSAVDQSHLGQIVFAAPDIDRATFDQQIAVEHIKPVRVTLYASSHDQALRVSEILNRGSRLGDARPDIDIKEGMDSVDASDVDTSLLGHSYIGASRSVLADFATLVSSNAGPDKRFGVLTEGSPPNRWWKLNP